MTLPTRSCFWHALAIFCRPCCPLPLDIECWCAGECVKRGLMNLAHLIDPDEQYPASLRGRWDNRTRLGHGCERFQLNREARYGLLLVFR